MMLTYVIVVLFLGMAGYLANFVVFDSEEVINNPRNKRQEVMAERVTKGSILSADGKVLAETSVDSHGKVKRHYPQKKVFCHVVGRTDNSMTGIEMNQCYPMLTSHSNPLVQLSNTLKGQKSRGDDVVTTLDARLQKTAYRALGSFRGAAVAMEPATGKILAMVSKPSYDPNKVLQQWDSLVEDSKEESKLINRATQGLYPPGSTFKIVTALEYLQENQGDAGGFNYKCKGAATFGGNKIKCYGGEKHGREDLKRAFAKSCNGAFALIGTGLDLNRFHKFCNKLGFNKTQKFNFETNKSVFSLNASTPEEEVAQTSIGQGKTLITPLENLMITSMVANDGEMMKPYVVDHLQDPDGRETKKYEPKSLGSIVDKDSNSELQNMMREVIKSGTGSSLSGLGYSVAGKTGSAEVDSNGTTHSWFVGYAPANNPKIAVSIVVESSGTGSKYAVPVAKKMFENYLE